VMVFGIFTIMVLGNIFNWTIGGLFMRLTGFMVYIPKVYLLPSVLLVTLTSVYVQDVTMTSVYITIGFGFLGYFMRKLNICILPFVIAFILADNLETILRQAFSASGGNPYFFFESPISMVFFALIGVIIYFFGFRKKPDAKIPLPQAMPPDEGSTT